MREANSNTARALRVLPPLLLLVLLIVLWELYVSSGGIDEFLLPAPSTIVESSFRAGEPTLLLSNFWVTAKEMLLGLGCALVLGAATAFAIHFSRTLRSALYPLIVASQTIPIVIVAPLLVAMLGFGLLPKLVIVTLVCFFPITVTALDGLARIDPRMVDLMYTFGASRGRAFRTVELPAAMPSLFSGVRLSVAIAAIGAVLAEQAGSSEGIGHMITQAIPQFQTSRAYAGVILLALFSIFLFVLCGVLERLLLPWTEQAKRTDRRAR